MRKIKSIIIAAVLVVFGTSVFAEDATVTFVSGKVEVQRGGKWIALQKGDKVAKAETISTGFQSEAKIKIIDSVMYLGPVTRITLEELSTANQTDNVNVYLKTGTTRSQVKHVDNKRVNYQVHTAVAVASCRGTDWILDDSNTIKGLGGTVEYNDTESASRSVGGVLIQANQTAKLDDNNNVTPTVSNVVSSAEEVNSTAATAGSLEGEGGAGAGTEVAPSNGGNNGGGDTPEPTGTVVITIELPE
ncbi:FecR family protein [Treponema bryantii]|uniref:FecR family protein n=2 Tax=Treponema bryantii TaxID=163 RepID=A0A1H9C576_9SPIR|nr:FecR domain-containing protein [Treponema bryantii]SEP96254.1 FecR family protein [Treponema bryantii]